MKTDIENIPENIFEWIETKSFQSLLPLEKSEVLRYISEIEYIELYNNTQLIKNYGLQNRNKESTSNKQNLLERFDKKHHRKHPIIAFVNYRIPVWQSLAAMILLGIGIAQSYQFINNKPPKLLAQQIFDTVYVNVETLPKVLNLHDTICLQKVKNKKHFAQISTDKQVQTILYNNSLNENILSIKDLNNAANNKKGLSINEDTLIKSFEYVKL